MCGTCHQEGAERDSTDSCMHCTQQLRAPCCSWRDPPRTDVGEVARDGDLERALLDPVAASGGEKIAVEAGLTARVQQSQAQHGP